MASTTAATILIVEEEVQLQQLLRELLIRTGYQVLLAATGAVAARLYEQHRNDIDLIVFDGLVPELGQLACRHPGLKMLALSESGERLPVDCPVLCKPFTPVELMTLIQSLSAPRRARPSVPLQIC